MRNIQTFFLTFLLTLFFLGFASSLYSAEYLGCYKDSSNRDLNFFAKQSNRMTTQKCLKTCYKKGYQYASTQYGGQCFCGNSYGRYGRINNCNMPCSGNKGQICGGTWANSVYRVKKKPTIITPPLHTTTQGQYLGCYKDNSHRDINGYTFRSRNMTKNKCLNTCRNKGFYYASTQYASHCFCGNSYGRYGKARNCNMACSGNNNQTCGGSWANSVYRVKKQNVLLPHPPLTTPSTPNVKTKAHYLGCYKDNSNRDVNGYTFRSPKMTKNKCLNTCNKKGYKYASTQYSSHCFCGNSYGRYGKARNCNMPCSGNRSQICGGSWANSIYRLDNYVKTKPPVLIHPGLTPTHAKYLGCYKDSSHRDLHYFAKQSHKMTTKKCLKTCKRKGYRYASTQYGGQCFCGNSYGKYGRARNCNMKCSGNKNQICGGTWANSVYKVK